LQAFQVVEGVGPVVADDVTRSMFSAYEAGGLITMCAWCKRVVLGGEWARAPHMALTAIDARNSLSHGICPACVVAPLD
jgi:hypothetical protein